ncbi:MAG: FKBP-type peptidyl-prolyl cis-trans isomerase [Thermoplasmata archaeon]
MANRPSYWPAVILLAVVIAAAGGTGAALAHFVFRAPSPSAVKVVRLGDNVTVNYIGFFASGPQAGKVFDTSRYGVAINNVTYPKSLEFSFRGNASAYTQLGVHIGSSTPTGGYVIGNWTFVSVIPGFWQGMIGMTGNTSRTINISVQNAYGPASPACFRSQPLVFQVPTIQSYSWADFNATFPGITPTTGGTFTNPTYGWTDSVLVANATTVTLQNLPTLGERVSPNGIPYVVNGTGPESITVRSLLTAGQAGTVLGHLGGGGQVCGSSKFIVSGIDWSSNTMTWNFNPEVDGQALEFYVTVVNIFPA